jgi:hypothetical protein
VQEVEVVLDRLARQALALLGQQVGGNPGGVDLLQRLLAEERAEVLAQVAAVVRERRALALHHVLEMIDVGPPGLIDRPPLRARDDAFGLHPSAQFAFGLSTRQPVGRARLALGAELAFDPGDAQPPGSVPGLRAVRICADMETA